MKLESTAFQDQEVIPSQHTGEGENHSPPLRWSGLPQGTKTVAIVCQDIDARIQPHHDTMIVQWIIYNIPADAVGLPSGIPQNELVTSPVRAVQGMNSLGKVGYSGPLPPAEGHHRYLFQLYALDCELPLQGGAMLYHLLKAMEGHILAETQLIGRYQRDRKSFHHTVSIHTQPKELGL